MSIKGNTVGTTMPRSDWAQTDPKKADYIKNKPDLSGIEEAQRTADAAVKAAGNAATAASNAATAASNAQSSANNAQSTADEAKTLAQAAQQTADNAVTADYVDGKHLSGSITLSASGWSSGAQTVSVSGILATDMPHWGVVYGTNKEAEKEAFALVDELETDAGKFTFRCFEDVPTVALTIQWEVNR